MQIKMFVIKPTDHNGFFFFWGGNLFLAVIPPALNAAEMYFCVRSGSGNACTSFFLFFYFFLHLFCASRAFNSCTSDGHVKQLGVPIGKAVVRGNGTIYSASLVVEVM